ncbi:hypothetical protein MOMA_01545 [Moraxella macacae 0408225]|uniref:DUF1285 domain-containing protein n=1 Tax=Moraxella macacae 0408225 TaxID=1230338 RepID=L2F7R3_9GAMM|nr:DUF1285 domain-containing protein [Moraxella macacae]ELA09052.1 hypothetical protein MOMA_01545 [Moraxella macacae 0408225]
MKQEVITQLQNFSIDKNNQQKTLPLEKWQPQFCGKMDLVIKANGEWWHDGQKMTRQSMIDLFASVLWAEIDEDNQIRYFLKTPVEKVAICVEDAPLYIVNIEQIQAKNQTFLQFTTAQGEVVIADKQHPISLGLPFANVAPHQANQAYIKVKEQGGSVLYGLIPRSLFYHLVAMGDCRENLQGQTVLRLQSGDCQFELLG